MPDREGMITTFDRTGTIARSADLTLVRTADGGFGLHQNTPTGRRSLGSHASARDAWIALDALDVPNEDMIHRAA